ncbi:MAG: DNA polymerase III subunit beta [Nitrospirae bacterium]|nr:DNA polymerase III subunit beta [Nitrospirota bacterium]
MKLKVERKELLTGLQRVQGVVEKKVTMPILSNIKIETDSKSVKLTATDLEIGITGVVKADVQDAGGIAVSAKKLYEIVRELPEGTININVLDGGRLELRSGNSLFVLMCAPVEEYPAIPEIGKGKFIPIEKKTLSEMIKKTIFAVGENDTRYILNGALMNLSKESVHLIGTDGHRLAVIEKAIKGPSDETTVIVPKKALTEVKKLIDEEGDENIEMGFGKNLILFKKGDTEIICRLMEGTYPNYKQVIPAKNEVKISVNKKNLEGALRRVSILSREKANAVKLELSEGRITAVSTNPDMGEATEDIPVEYNGPPIFIGFNAKYILDTLSVIEGEEVILEMQDSLSPCIIKDKADKDYLCVVMPMRL